MKMTSCIFLNIIRAVFFIAQIQVCAEPGNVTENASPVYPLYGIASGNPDPSRMDLEILARGFTLVQGSFDREDIAVGKLLKDGLELGFEIGELAFYPRLADEIVANELDLRQRHTRDLSFEEDAALTLGMTPVARGLRAYVIDRVMQRRLIAFKGLKDKEKP